MSALRTASRLAATAAFALAGALADVHAEPCKNHYILDEIPPCSPDFLPAGWAPTAPMNLARWGHTASLLPDGRVLVLGGGENASAELYDPATHSWRMTQPMAGTRSWHTATVLRDGRVLAVGGSRYTEQGAPRGTAEVEIYDPGTDAWQPVASTITPRSNHTATLLLDGTVLIAGGWSNVSAMTDDALRSAVLYDPATGTFRSTGSLAAARYGHTATLLPDGRVLVTGGSNSGDLEWTLSTAELYDPSTGEWTAAGHFATGRIWHSATLSASGHVVVTGGYTGGIGGGKTLSLLDIFDPQSGTWTRGPDMQAPRFGHAAISLADGRILVAGGVRQRGGYPPGVQYDHPATSELFDAGTASWSSGAELLETRVFQTATRLLDGRVLVTGGYVTGPNYSMTVLPTAEYFGGAVAASEATATE